VELTLGGLSPAVVLLILLAAVAGGMAQSALGFGAAFIAVPALALTAPELLPGSVLVGILPLSIVMVLRAHRDVDVRAVARITIGRLPGILVGTAAVVLLPDRTLTIVVASMLLASVGASASGWQVAVTGRREIAAGFVSGVTGTAAALGGPPLALLYRGAAGSLLRPTLAAVWAVGLLPILLSLGLAGEFTARQAQVGSVIAVAMLLGLVGGVPVVQRVPDVTIRRAVLWWAAVGGTLALVRALLAS
jgi:uncharacterized protein